MLKRIQIYIEQEPWDEEAKRQFKRIDRACLLIILIALVYFVPSIINIVTR